LLYFGERLVIHLEGNLINKIKFEFHFTHFVAHTGINKMRENIKKYYYLHGMKGDIMEYVTNVLNSKR